MVGVNRWISLAILGAILSFTGGQFCLPGSGPDDTGHRYITSENGKILCGHNLMSTVIAIENLSKKYIIGHQKRSATWHCGCLWGKWCRVSPIE